MDTRIAIIKQWARTNPTFDLSFVLAMEKWVKHSFLTSTQSKALDNIIKESVYGEKWKQRPRKQKRARR